VLEPKPTQGLHALAWPSGQSQPTVLGQCARSARGAWSPRSGDVRRRGRRRLPSGSGEVRSVARAHGGGGALAGHGAEGNNSPRQLDDGGGDESRLGGGVPRR
jgi:hypothetical protein